MTCQQYQVRRCTCFFAGSPSTPGHRAALFSCRIQARVRCPSPAPRTTHCTRCVPLQAQPGALRSKEDQALLDLAEQEGMRRCPACGAMVQRTQVGDTGGGGGLCSGGMGGEVACGGSCGCPLGLCMVASSPAGAMLWRPQRPPLVYKHASAQPRLPACPLPSAGLLIHVVPLRRPLLLRLRQAQGQRRAVDPFGCGFSPDCCSCCSGPA